MISTSELAKEVGISDKGIEYHLQKMKIQGIIARVEPDKGGCWQIIWTDDPDSYLLGLQCENNFEKQG